MTTSAQFEHESERTRAHLNDTVAELRSRLTVGQVADEIWELAKDGVGGDFAKNLARQAAANPMPVALVGTGLAWLMFAKSSPGVNRDVRSASQMERAAHAADGLGIPEEEEYETQTNADGTLRRVKKSVSRTMHDARDAAAAAGATVAEGYEAVTEGASDLASSAYGAAKQGVDAAKVTASSAYDAAKQGVDAAKATAGSAYDSIKKSAAAAQDMAASGYENIKESAMQTTEVAASSAKAAGEYASDTAQRVADFCVENPLVLIGAGMALGAIAGALLPATEMENELMGEASDQVKQQAEHLATAQVEKVEKVGEQILDSATESAAREFAPDAASELTPDDVDGQLQKNGAQNIGGLSMEQRGTNAMP